MKAKTCFILFPLILLCWIQSPAQVWKQYIDSANLYTAKNDTSMIIECYYKIRGSLQKDSVNTITYAAFCDSLGYYYYIKEQYKEAEEAFQEAKEIQEKLVGRKNIGYAYSCSVLGLIYTEMELDQKAMSFLTEAKEIREEILGKNNISYLNSCRNLARSDLYNRQFEQAVQLYQEAKSIQERMFGKENTPYAGDCENLATSYHLLSEYKKAEYYYIESLRIHERISGKESNNYLTNCVHLAVNYMFMDEYEKAEVLIIEAKQQQEKFHGKSNWNYTNYCINLAGLYIDLGQYKKAEPLFIEAKNIRLRLSGKKNIDYVNVCSNLAGLYTHTGESGKALELYFEEKELLEKIDHKESYEYINTCKSLADLYLKRREFTKAQDLINQIKPLALKVLGKNNAEILYVQAALYFEKAEYSKAEKLYRALKDSALSKVGKNHLEYGEVCAKLALVYNQMHQPGKAEKEYKELFAVDSFRLNALFKFTNESEKNAFIKTITNEDNKAYSFYVSNKMSSDHPYELSLFNRNLILSASQNLVKQLFNSKDTLAYNKYKAWIELKKNLAGLYAKPVEERNEDEVYKIEEASGNLEKELTKISATFKKQTQQTGWKNIRDSLKANEASIEFIEYNYYDGRHYTGGVNYMAMVLRKDKPFPVLVPLFEKKQLNRLLIDPGNRSTNESVTNLYASRGIIVKGANDIAVNSSTYSLIWKPLEKELIGITTIYFAPAGLLHRIAFAALPVNKKQVLSDRFNLVQLATTASVTDQASSYISSTDKIQLYGGINYDTDSTSLKQSATLYPASVQNENSRSVPTDLTRSGTFNFLTGTANEIKSIENESLGANNHVALFAGDKATEESFKAMNGNASPSIIHIATHGFFFPDPENKLQERNNETSGKVFRQSDNPLFRSGLLFAGANNAWQGKPVEGIEDGILTAYEVSNMYLPNTKLAVLSACETALGDIQGSEGVYGLQRAFKIAGVQNMVMSLWKVPDAETAEFMQLFYKNMFIKQSISDAFYHAQSAMRNKYRKDPYKWAAWVLVR